MTGTGLALLGTLALAVGLCVWAHLTLRPGPDRPTGRRVPLHAKWTTEGSTEPLGPRRLDPLPDMERDGGLAQRLRWPGMTRVLTCEWCPDPEHPGMEWHPGGQVEHVERS